MCFQNLSLVVFVSVLRMRNNCCIGEVGQYWGHGHSVYQLGHTLEKVENP